MVPLALTALVGIALLPVLVGSRSFYHLDTYSEHVPYWHFAASTVAAGKWPLWTPNIRAGYPLQANGEASLLYPLTLPFSLTLPAHRAIDLFVLLHLALLGVVTWCYLRELSATPAAAFFGAAAFALSGRMIASTIWPNATTSASNTTTIVASVHVTPLELSTVRSSTTRPAIRR